MLKLLYESLRHVTLGTASWDPAAARSTIEAIARTTAQAYDPVRLWPAHSRDQPRRGGPDKTVYAGAAGIIAALALLERRGFAEPSIDLRAAIEGVHQSWAEAPDAGSVPSVFLGESGILLVRWALDPDRDVERKLARSIKSNEKHPALEQLWGSPGTMLVALQMEAWTGDDRWKVLYLESADHLLNTWRRDDSVGAWLWQQQLWGRTHRMLGACHGAMGALQPLIAGAPWIDARFRRLLMPRAEELLAATAVVENGCANWPPEVNDRGLLVQWCHGAPGVVVAFDPMPRGESADLEQWMLRAGELIWNAGPLAKGVGLCHGTSGNGYAFLKLHRRTGDSKWLERARAYAMQAIAQHQAATARQGAPWFSLWTGDLGLALFLADCVEGQADMPFVDGLKGLGPS